MGYNIKEDGRLYNTNVPGEIFRISNRSFEEIDYFFRGLATDIIQAYVDASSDRINILDVGGGSQSQSAKDISGSFGESVSITNIDLLAEPLEQRMGVFPIKGDIFNLPFQDETFDIIYSRHVIPSLERTSDKTRGIYALKQIDMKLKKGGVAILDDDYLTRLSSQSHEWRLLSEQFASELLVKDSNRYPRPLRERMQINLGKKYGHSQKLLLMVKQPSIPAVVDSIGSVSDRLPLLKRIKQ